MSDVSEATWSDSGDDPSARTRTSQSSDWLFQALIHRASSGEAIFPPRPLVQAILGLELAEQFDLGWAVFDHDQGEEVTRWEGVVANSSVMVEFVAKGKPQGGTWNGNSTARTTAYAVQPAITLTVLKFIDVTGLTVSSTGASDAESADHQLEQEWTFTFARTEPIVKRMSANDERQPGDLLRLCQRIAAHL